jgi:Domain of unknown function (DUF4261)
MGIFGSSGKKKKSAKSKPESAPAEDTTTTRHCFVLCEQERPANWDIAADAVAQVFGPGYSAEVDEEKGMVSISHDGEFVGILAHMPAPVPEGEAAHNADANFLWPNGKEEAEKHQSHVIVTNMGAEEQSPVDSAISVSKLALVALKLFDGLGVYWGNANVSNSREVFEDFCENISQEQLPVPVWLRFQPIQTGDDQVGIYTLGMQQFGLMDIEIDDSPMDLEDLFFFVVGIAQYLIDNGPVIEDGNTVGGSEDERIVVRHRPSMIDEERLVYKMLFNEE